MKIGNGDKTIRPTLNKDKVNNIWFTLHEVGVVLRQEDRVSIDYPRFAKYTQKNLPANVFNFQWTKELSVLDLTN